MSSPESSDALDALSTLVRRHGPSLVGVARGEGLTPEEAIECVQDALCAMLADADTPSEDDHRIASLKTRIRNLARNARRRHRRALPHVVITPEDEPASDVAFAEDLVAHAEEVVRLRMCVAELCSVKRAVVMLRLLEERSGEDVAASLGLSRGYVDVLTHRAKADLRVCMRHGQ